jgi:hypothetical protein
VRVLFAQVIDSVDDRITSQVKGVTISLELLMLSQISADDFPDLDLANTDDQIVAEALVVQQQRTGTTVPGATWSLRTCDTPLLSRAAVARLHLRLSR